MKVFIHNNQNWSVMGRFSIDQRRFAWTLRKHPKKFSKGTWALVTVYERGDAIPKEMLEQMLDVSRDHFRRAAEDMQQLTQMRLTQLKQARIRGGVS